jgi:hypothetical protein
MDEGLIPYSAAGPTGESQDEDGPAEEEAMLEGEPEVKDDQGRRLEPRHVSTQSWK